MYLIYVFILFELCYYFLIHEFIQFMYLLLLNSCIYSIHVFLNTCTYYF